MSLRKIFKVLLGYFFGLSFFSYLQFKIYKLLGRKYIVSVTYHDTPEKDNHKFRQHLQWYKRYFSNCSKSDLEGFIERGEWKSEKPGIIISFDDGLLSNFLNAKKELEFFGFTGWFMIPAGIIDLPSEEHVKFASNGLIDYTKIFDCERLFMNRQEILELKKSNHEVVAHSNSHVRLSKDLSKKELMFEINLATSIISKSIDHKVNSFAWVGGEEFSYSESAIQMMKESGIKFVFATNCSEISALQNPMMLERFHVETGYNLKELAFSISWAYKLMYRAKRKRLKQLLFGNS